MGVEAKSIETKSGTLWLLDTGKVVELDVSGRVSLPAALELDEDAVHELRGWVDRWLAEREPPQQELDVTTGVGASAEDPTEPASELSDPDAKQLGPFARESEMSRQAALEAYPKQGSQRWQIIELFRGQWIVGKRRDGWTRDELAEKLGLSPNTIRPRVCELIEGGWLEESDRTRPSAAGHDSAVLVFTAAAIEHCEKHRAYR